MIRFSQLASIRHFWGACLVLAVFLAPSASQAGFTIRVGNGDGQTSPWGGPIVAGTNGVTIPVFIRADTSQDTLRSYFLAMEFGGENPGFGTPSGLSNFDADFSTAQFGDIAAPQPPAVRFNGTLAGELAVLPGFENSVNFDFVVNNSSSTSVVPTTFTKLFDLKFDVDANANAGVYDVKVVLNTTPFLVTSFATDGGNTVPLSSFTVQQGSIQITAVPEPSSMALLGVAGIGAVAWRRIRRRSATK